MSLRTRLALLAASAIVALLVALFVAWRLARATETFALREADSSVNGAVHDLARELASHPNGYQTIEDATEGPPDRGPGRGPDQPNHDQPGNQPDPDRPGIDRRGPDDRPARPVPPHIRSAFAAYADPLARMTAITLHRFPDVEGGFCRTADNAIVGYAFDGEGATNRTQTISPELAGVVGALAKQATATGAPALRTIQRGSERLTIAVFPIPPESVRSGGTASSASGISAAWAMQRISHVSGVSDWPNIVAVILLGFSILMVSGIALVTVRDLRSGVAAIETGLSGLTADLGKQVTLPNTAELARIAQAINELAANLRANIARQAELEQELRFRERLSALGRVVAGVAHEVRNPLAAIKLKVQMARRAAYPPEKLDETFDVVTAEVDRLDRLVRRLLVFGEQPANANVAIDLRELVATRVAFFGDVAARSGVTIATEISTGDLVVQGDRDRLAQVMDNIIQNAIEAMPNGGGLTIKGGPIAATPGRAHARLSFTDSGPGIAAGAHEQIFEPFHSGRDTGTGLGLAIARSIAGEFGGRLALESCAGGASFVLELPLAPAADTKAPS